MAKKTSGSGRVVAEKLGAQLFTGRKVLGFKRRPPLGIDCNVVPQPVGDELLACGGPMSLQSIGELGLTAASSLNSPLQGSGVLAHGAGDLHKQACPVNRQVCVTLDKKVCNVVDLSNYRHAAVPKTLRRLNTAKQKPAIRGRKASPGADGKTLGERLQLAMAHRAGMLGRNYEAVDLLQDANRAAGASMDAPVISQQMISEILRNRTTRSSFTPFLAKACGVSVLWLANGRGQMVE